MLALLVSIGGVLLAAHGQAAGEDPEALIRQGVQLRKAGENAKALGYFQRAYDIARTARTAAQLGLASLALGKWVDAESRLTEALSASDPWVDSYRPALEQARTSARTQLGKIELEGAPPAATVEVNGRPTAPVPRDGALWVAPGPVRLRVEAPGFKPTSRDLSIAAGASTRIHLALEATRVIKVTAAPEPVATGASPPPADHAASGLGLLRGPDRPGDDDTEDRRIRRRRFRVASIVTASAGVALAITGYAFRAIATQKLNAIARDADPATDRPYNPDNGNFRTFDQVGVGLMIGGAAAVGAGVITYLVNRDSAPRRLSWVSPQAGPGQVGLRIAGGF